jgi:DNA-binding response OmpR family regulator
MDIDNTNIYQNVRLAVGEPNRVVRTTLVSQFKSFGFQNIISTASLDDIKEAVINDLLDLIICDEGLKGDFCGFMSDIRHHRIGHNPFMVTVATTDGLTADKMKTLADSGIDDLVAKPLSVGKLLSRLEYITTSRKPFVVTTGYTGPDRRTTNQPREGKQDIDRIDVPNPLVYLTGKNQSKADTAKTIAQAAGVINEHKMERHSYQLGFLIDRILPLYKGGRANEVEAKDLANLVYVSQDISNRLKGTRFSDASDLCRSMTDLAIHIQETPLDPDPKDLGLLQQLSMAIQMAFKTAHGDTTSIDQIVKALKAQKLIPSKAP